ncbi:hypothetical protein QBC40DRAFT_341869 [Triangularia verruculosa]|uniref:BZIP transcription factor n=1 Tax=Triangularia verruculosa TaxID=2587418 RepID=A0AAN6XBC4_9PEZI|nr:hypothetical protein QBC40DRAFT_341869 [Triangularia verruculosa]
MAGNHANLNRTACTPAAFAPAPAPALAPTPTSTSAFSGTRGGGPLAASGSGSGSGSGVVGGFSSGESQSTASPMSSVNIANGNTNNLPDAAGGNNAGINTKKRKAAPGSRGVANLTPEQLAKKRANDREAQRAIRERQRLKIEQYEREIRELKSQQPYQELQAAIRQREAVEAELAEVKACLATIMHLAQPVLAKGSIVGQQQPAPLPSPAPTHHAPSLQHHHGLAAPTPTSAGFSGSGPGSVASPGSVGTHGRWHSSMSPVVGPMTTESQHQQHHQLQQPQPPSQTGILTQQRHDLVHGLDLGSDRLDLEFLLDPAQKIARIQQNITTPSPTPYQQPQPQIPLLIPPTTTTIKPQNHPPLPLNCPPTCPLDSILLDFLSERRNLLSHSHPATTVLGPPHPSITPLLNPSAPSHPLSKVFADILARFPGLSNLPERVAVLYLMFLLMRWQIDPTQENWERIPVYLRPGRAQREKAHPAWVDHIPWPEMRGYIIENHDFEDGGGTGGKNGFLFENFFIPFTGTLRVGWGKRREGEGGKEGVGKDQGEEEEEEEIMINPVFERHLSRLECWSLGEEFERAFPQLRGTYKLRR